MTLISALTGDDEIASLLSDKAQVAAMLRVEAALAEASAEAGLISGQAAAAIVAAAGTFQLDWDDLKKGMQRDGVVLPALVSQLRGALPEPQRFDLHRGATSQDIIDTALMLQLAQVIGVLEQRLGQLQERLGDLDAAHAATPLMAHTRMQAALPFTWGNKLRSWSEPLTRYRAGLAAARRSLLVVQLGGPVGDLESFEGYGEAIARGLARRLDLGIAPPWHATRDPIVAFGGLLALISGSLGKIGADVSLLAQSEVAAVRLKGGGGSSAMAHKNNPIAAEVLVSLARFNAGLSGTLQQAMVHENERSGAAWALEWMVLPQMAISAGASLRLGLVLLDQMRVGHSDEGQDHG